MTAFPRCSLCAKDLWMENESWESGVCKSCKPKPKEEYVGVLVSRSYDNTTWKPDFRTFPAD